MTLPTGSDDKSDEAAVAKKAKAAEAKNARTGKKDEDAASLAHQKVTAAHGRLNGKPK